MDKKKLYSVIVFLFVSVVAINSVILVGVSGGKDTNSIRSILKNIDFDNYIGAIRDVDEDNSLDDGYLIEDGDGDEEDDGLDIDAPKRRIPKPRKGDEPKTVMAVQSSHGGIVIEQSSRRVLKGESIDERCFPASTTKVLTALVVLNSLPLDRVVTVPKIAEGVEGSSIYLRAGQKITVEDLLYGMMLRSGNDAATALAVETAGSIEKFAELMNETAKALGAENSHFVNPHGLHDDDHYTTAYDLALITAKAYENPDFVKIVSSEKAKILIDGEPSYIGNKNKMLKLYGGANGVKTGYTKRSGRCLVSGAYRGGMQLICVVLNYNDMWNDSMSFLNYGFDNYEMKAADEAFAGKNKDAEPIEIAGDIVDGEWKSAKYPLKKDGSEYIVLKAA